MKREAIFHAECPRLYGALPESNTVQQLRHSRLRLRRCPNLRVQPALCQITRDLGSDPAGHTRSGLTGTQA